jgi:hypothetical protein
MAKHTAFWDDLARDLQDPEFRREFLEVAYAALTLHCGGNLREQ